MIRASGKPASRAAERLTTVASTSERGRAIFVGMPIETCDFSVMCMGCKRTLPVGPPVDHVIVCTDCGNGQRLRFRYGTDRYSGQSIVLSIDSLEPPNDPNELPISSGALAPGARDSRGAK